MSLLWDTSAIIAYYNCDDKYNTQAKKVMDSVKRGHSYRKFYITDYILDETLTFMECVLRDHNLAEEVGESLMESTIVSRKQIDEKLLQESWELFKTRRGRSFTDCTSFSFMKRAGLRAAFTFDAHFIDEGFEVVS